MSLRARSTLIVGGHEAERDVRKNWDREEVHGKRRLTCELRFSGSGQETPIRSPGSQCFQIKSRAMKRDCSSYTKYVLYYKDSMCNYGGV